MEIQTLLLTSFRNQKVKLVSVYSNKKGLVYFIRESSKLNPVHLFKRAITTYRLLNDRDLLGYVVYRLHWWKVAEIDFLFVNKTYRGSRMGKSLMITTLHELKRRGIKTVVLAYVPMTGAEEVPEKLYKSLGFERVDNYKTEMELKNLQKRRLPKMYFKD